ncbi:glycoside hydrolase family 2 protein [Rufibacter immobilis]|uniref:Glycoside hydrolase family 2 protein n=1 Tax=Rufibacter immobilis TaxID=1348778 RepID=A0A3M9N5A1_9BACT|nr:beta-galactosidase GalA [Rufibacter immobilis]RNI32487.1 glycoside hydrolase family 2 protein [Rufibacter immobilis]
MSRLKTFVFLCFLLFTCGAFAQEKSGGRQRLLMDFNWQFAFGHPSDTQKDFNHGNSYFSYLAKAGYGDGPADPKFDDRAWRQLNLPHDWAVEQEFSPQASFSHGFKAIGRNFPDRSVGWYRKTFAVPASDLGRRIALEFDGAFRDSKVWVNGHYVGTEPSGYNSFRIDISEYLHYGSDNVVAVRVDATMEEGWYYEGAGIYRHVWLSKTNPLHVAPHGTFVTSQVNNTNAQVTARASIVNEDKTLRTFSVVQTIVDATGKTVATQRQENLTLAPFQTQDVRMVLPVTNATLWDLDAPYLYQLVTTVLAQNQETDRYVTPFGIRTIRFSAKEGFFLNGKHVKLKGTNNHQEHAGVGTALPDELQYWRIKTLKAMGSNAYRSSHHPPTPELLEACDKLGMLVINENRLMGTSEQRMEDLKRLILRDRNHPSVISWSIGNEEWAIENSIIGARMATTMQAYAQSLDSTRAVSAGISGGFRSGISDVLEVMGYNYLGNGDIEAHHRDFPNQPSMGTEEGSTFATRGVYVTDLEKHYQAAYDRKPRPSFYSIEEGWTFYANRPWLAGMFIWTGFDYRGEPTPHVWPSVTSYFGMMDNCGFPKDNVYYLRSWWSGQPTLHLLPHWNWPGKEGQEIDVRAYSNCEEVELFLNKKSLGRQTMKPNSHLAWKVKYAPGTLEAIGYKNGQKVLTDVVKTTGPAASVQLNPYQTTLKANGEDLAIITVSVTDKNKMAVPIAHDEITFQLKGPGKIIGVGNGDPTSLEKDRFIEDIKAVGITDLQEKPLQSMPSGPAALPDAEGGNWIPAFLKRDYKNLAPAYVHRGTFELPAHLAGAEITFYYKSIGREQSIYINGQEVAQNLKEDPKGNVFKLNHALLKPGKNTLEIVATPIPKKYDWDNVNTDPGTLQILTPAPAWKRKLFNGLAQIIIQTTKEAGEITLTATGKGLKPAVLKLKAAAAEQRPAMP